MGYEFNSSEAISVLKRFITGQLLKSGLDGYVVGLSGGIDSALSATLAVKAVGAGKVFGILMPYKASSKSSVEDAKTLVKQLGIESKLIDISPMIDSYYDKIDNSNRLRAGNKMARERMSILFDHAHRMNRLVLGTGNRTEIALGYTTLFGDSACSIDPLGELYKTEVRQLSRELDVPKSIIDKPPSADLWADQTDEGEIGVSYENIDRLLRMILDEGVNSMTKLIDTGLSQTDISRVVSMMNFNSFKRKLPDIAPLGRKPIPEIFQLED